MCLNLTLFVIVVILMVLPWSHSDYIMNKGVKTLVATEEQPGVQDGFEDIETTANYWDWLRDKVIASIFLHDEQTLAALGPGYVRDGASGPGDGAGGRFHWFPYGRLYLIGPVRLRQIRSQAVACSFNAIRFVTLQCHDSLTQESYGPPNAAGGPSFQWTTTDDRSYRGLLDVYPSGGYVQYLYGNATALTAEVDALEASAWIDIQTTAVFTSFSLYNPNLNRIVHAMLLMEQPHAAGIVLSYKFSVVNLFPEADSEYEFLILLHAILAICIVLLVATEVLDLLRYRLRYFLSGWTFLDIVLIAGLVLYLSFYGARLEIEPRIYDVARLNEGRYLNLADVIYYQRAELICLMVVVFVLALRFMRYATLHPRVHLYLIMMSGVFSALLSFLVLFFLISLGFAFVSHLMFREDVEEYSTIPRAMFANIGVLLGETAYDEWVVSNRFMAYTFFLSYSITTSIFLLNLVVSVLSDAFANREDQSREKVSAASKAVRSKLKKYKYFLSCGRYGSASSSVRPSHATSVAMHDIDPPHVRLASLNRQLAHIQSQIQDVLSGMDHQHQNGIYSSDLGGADDHDIASAVSGGGDESESGGRSESGGSLP